MLQDIFDHQLELMHKVHARERVNGLPVPMPDQYGTIDRRDTQLYLKHIAWCVVEELGEAMNELKNRPWKATFTQTDRPAYYEELVDVVHFMVELLIASGMKAEDLHQMYLGKHAENMSRQERGY
jgi:hypothetical protein